MAFQGSATGTGLTYTWNFGDGQSTTGTLTPAHAYADNGNYTVTLTVTNGSGQTATDTALVTVGNVAPTATVGHTSPVNEGSPVNVFFQNMADVSTVDSAAGFKYSFDFNNDGVWDVVDSTTPSAQTTFTDNGTYLVSMRIKDKDGGTNTYVDQVGITNAAPTATLSNNGPVQPGSPVTVTFTNSQDPSGADTAAGFRYSFDFNNDGTFEVVNSTTPAASYTFAAVGTYIIRGRIADKDGGFTDYTTNIIVSTAPPPPTANAGPNQTGNEGSFLSFNGSATGTGLTYSWNFGDGQTTPGTLTPTHRFVDNGTYTVTLTVTNTTGQSASDTATVIVNNVAPTATFTGPGTGTVGTPATFAFTNSQDVSSADTAAGFRYSYDFNNDGTFEVTNSTVSTASYNFTSAGTYSVRGRIADKDGGFIDYTSQITVNPSTPTGYQGILRTLYVSTTGTDTANGSSATPFRTLQRAADIALPGDMIVVRAGTYIGFQITRSGTATNPIVFKADPGVTVNAKLPTVSSSAGAINLEGASYVAVDGFNVTLATYGTVNSNIRSVSNTGVIIRNNVINNAAWWGIMTGFSQNVLIENNHITNTVIQHGIYVGNSADNPIVRGNYVSNSRFCGIQINSDASQGGDGIVSGALVEGNTLLGNAVGGGASMNFDGVQSSIIRNNVIRGNRNGIALYRIDGAQGARNNWVVGNTIVFDAGVGYFAVQITDGSTGNKLFNNILYRQAGGSYGSVGIDAASRTGFQSDYNVVVNGFNLDPFGDQPVTLAQWRSQTGQDMHSIVATPAQLFVDAANNDFRLRPGSPAIDAGINLAQLPTDILGVARPAGAGTNIGAYE